MRDTFPSTLKFGGTILNAQVAKSVTTAVDACSQFSCTLVKLASWPYLEHLDEGDAKVQISEIAPNQTKTE